jgi:8-hydroxy-5-deazaflavin:NADPH oxidoreductase
MKIGIIGAGFIGRLIATHGVRNGHEVMISNSRGPDSLRSAVAAIKCKSGFAEDAAKFGDVVFLAIPFVNYRSLPVQALMGKVVVDANNYYPDRDGPIPELDSGEATTSELTAAHLTGAKIVKAFNAIMANDLEKDGLPAGSAGRRALPMASDDKAAKALVAKLMDEFGFDVVDAGPLAEGWRFERARPAYCVPFKQDELASVLAGTTRESRTAEYSWRK